MIKRFRHYFSNDLSIDLGTANTLIYMRDKGIVLNEPSVVALKTTGNTKSVLAVGNSAKRMLGRTPMDIETVRPMKDGVIADFDVTEKMLQAFIRKVHEKSLLPPSPRVLVCVPCLATKVERKSIRETVSNAGAVEVYLFDEPMAAAIGAGMPVHEAMGSMVVDIGGGTTEIAIISLDGIVNKDSINFGGDTFDQNIVSYVRRQYGCKIGETTAEQIKIEVGSACVDEEVREIDVRGLNLAEGVPRSFTMTSEEVLEAIRETLTSIVDAVKKALEKCPPELASDIAERGIVVTGGGALLRNLDRLIREETSLPVVIADDCLNCVAKGGGMALEMYDKKTLEALSSN
ncbi:MAG: rod shape-determining protein [Pseudomonadota bacterium]|nr:rod shape-determining protein [Pseudomonadota bacterium]